MLFSFQAALWGCDAWIDENSLNYLTMEQTEGLVTLLLGVLLRRPRPQLGPQRTRCSAGQQDPWNATAWPSSLWRSTVWTATDRRSRQSRPPRPGGSWSQGVLTTVTVWPSNLSFGGSCWKEIIDHQIHGEETANWFVTKELNGHLCWLKVLSRAEIQLHRFTGSRVPSDHQSSVSISNI